MDEKTAAMIIIRFLRRVVLWENMDESVEAAELWCLAEKFTVAIVSTLAHVRNADMKSGLANGHGRDIVLVTVRLHMTAMSAGIDKSRQ